MLSKIKLRLKQETEEETALKQKYEQLRRKKARQRLRSIRNQPCWRCVSPWLTARICGARARARRRRSGSAC